MKKADDRQYWLQQGQIKELEFIELYGSRLGLKINPDKKHNKYAPDLEYTDGVGKAELKTQSTPWRRAYELFGIPPRFAFSFDEAAALRYSLYYPDLDVYLWDEREGAVFFVNMQSLVRYLPTCQKHIIKSRVELGSATDRVFIMDLRKDIFERLI